MTHFMTLPLTAPLLRALEVLQFTDMTPVQEQTLPALLEGQDLIGQAQTGSGKTVAFGLALLSPVEPEVNAVQSLVLCPTRELANQVSDEVRRLARFIPNIKVVTLCGGVPKRTQTPALVRAPQVVVGTPGRILDHMEQGNLDFSQLKVLVLDEGDRMLDMGFSQAIFDVTADAPKKRQTLLFSATFPPHIRQMSKRLQTDPVSVTVEPPKDNEAISETFFLVDTPYKTNAVMALLAEHQPESTLIFCHTKKDTKALTEELGQRGFSVSALHGDMEQRDRDEVTLCFANRSCSILVATDVAARGLDIKDLSAVISYELPDRADVHLHRIGRTGRAGKQGLAFSLVAPSEKNRVPAIEKETGRHFVWDELPANSNGKAPKLAPMSTFFISGGRKDKLRTGDLLGALTGDIGLSGEAVGKINILPKWTYLAVRREDAQRALTGLQAHKIKGRRFKVRLLE